MEGDYTDMRYTLRGSGDVRKLFHHALQTRGSGERITSGEIVHKVLRSIANHYELAEEKRQNF